MQARRSFAGALTRYTTMKSAGISIVFALRDPDIFSVNFEDADSPYSKGKLIHLYAHPAIRTFGVRFIAAAAPVTLPEDICHLVWMI